MWHARVVFHIKYKFGFKSGLMGRGVCLLASFCVFMFSAQSTSRLCWPVGHTLGGWPGCSWSLLPEGALASQARRLVRTVGFACVGTAAESHSSHFVPTQKIGYLVSLNLFPEDNKYQWLQIIMGVK